MDFFRYKKDQAGIWSPAESTGFSYSDGAEFEERILGQLQEASDLSVASDELQALIQDWPSEYHFSPLRTNLLYPFYLKAFSDVLEVGSGCGAITRLLGENGNRITALEGSYQRARITRERCRDLTNVEVINDTFENCSTASQFDLLTLIGVLEYSSASAAAENPFSATLRKAFDLLADNGVLVIAIENQLGLKYFNGAAEDHIGKVFYGIQGLYGENDPQTLGKRQLEELITRSGFNLIHFIYPFPDYKLPQLLIRDSALASNLNLGHLIGQYPSRDYSRQSHHLFLENKVWPIIAKNQLIADLANSFLIIAHKGDCRIDSLVSDWQIKTYTGRRRKKYLAENSFYEDENGWVAQKKACFPEASEHENSDTQITHHIGIETYHHGMSYHHAFSKRISNEGASLTEYIDYLKPWVDFLEKRLDSPDNESPASSRMLQGRWYDSIPSNIIVKENGNLEWIDQEWEPASQIPFEYLLIRGIADDLFRHWSEYLRSKLFHDMSFGSFFESIFAEFKLPYEQSTLEGFVSWDETIQKAISGQNDRPPHLQKLLDFRNQPLPQVPGITEAILSGDLFQYEQKIEQLEKARIELTRGLEEILEERKALLDEKHRDTSRLTAECEKLGKDRNKLNDELQKTTKLIHDIWNGPSWKIGRAVTYIPRKSKILLGRWFSGTKQRIDYSIGPYLRQMLFVLSGRFLIEAYRNGLSTAKVRLIEESRSYHVWYQRYYGLTNSDRQKIRQHIERFNEKPVISILIPTFNTAEKWLRLVIESVRQQLYPHWELCIADDASDEPHVRKIIEAYAGKDQRIKPVFRTSNGHISEATNSALELATGDFIALVDHDDELTEDALYHVALEINRCPDANLIYSDEDKIDAEGKLSNPYFKSDWNPDLLLSHNCITHLGVYRRNIVKKIGGLRKGFEGAQDWDLALRFADVIDHKTIRHIPRILYHWRTIPGSTALTIDSKSYAIQAQMKSVTEALERNKTAGEVVFDPTVLGCRVKYQLNPTPLVSIIIPTKDRVDLLKKCIDSIQQKTDYESYEIIVVDNDSIEAETKDYLNQVSLDSGLRIIRFNEPFNFSAINNRAAETANGSVLVLMNNDIEVINHAWLTELVSQAMRPEIGVVGAKLIYPDHLVQHAGLILGLVGGVAGVAHKAFAANHPGVNGRAGVIQNLSAVTAACFAVRKTVYDEVGGLNENDLKIAYNDVDFCLRVRDQGYRVLYTPYAQLYHHESVSRGYEDSPEKIDRLLAEQAYMKERWGERLLHDPYYNPNLTLEREDFSLAYPPRITSPWQSTNQS